jgi:hypothetical protein
VTNTIEVLKAARELISDPAHWTQEDFAKDVFGLPVEPLYHRAVCFCALGALAKAYNLDPHEIDHSEAAYAIADAVNIGVDYIPEFNDDHSHAEILAAFDAAIARELA